MAEDNEEITGSGLEEQPEVNNGGDNNGISESNPENNGVSESPGNEGNESPGNEGGENPGNNHGGEGNPDPNEQDTPSPTEDPGGSGNSGGSTASWESFDTGKAKAGMMAGFPVTGNPLDLSKAAPLEKYGLVDYSTWRIVIDGVTLLVDSSGTVVEVSPASEKFSVGETAQLFTAYIAPTKDSSYTTRDGSLVDLSSLSPRDQFAMMVLQRLIDKEPNPDAVDDAKILYYARAAYRYAQGMIMAASETRTGTHEETPPVVPTTAIEKILQGIGTAVNGLTTQLQASLAATLKVDNPTGDTFYIEGGGGSSDSSALSGLTDVALTSPANGQLLKFNGTKWVNGTDEGQQVSNLVGDSVLTGIRMTENGTLIATYRVVSQENAG